MAQQMLAADLATTAKVPDVSIHDAVKKGNIEAVQQHLAAGADVNAKDVAGGTPLHAAIGLGHKETVELLINKGSDVNAKVVSGPLQGSTPLDWAINFNHTETTDLLRKHGGKTKKELKAEGK